MQKKTPFFCMKNEVNPFCNQDKNLKLNFNSLLCFGTLSFPVHLLLNIWHPCAKFRKYCLSLNYIILETFIVLFWGFFCSHSGKGFCEILYVKNLINNMLLSASWHLHSQDHPLLFYHCRVPVFILFWTIQRPNPHTLKCFESKSDPKNSFPTEQIQSKLVFFPIRFPV